ncbi:ABC transporter permease [Paenactinomyces guangxiensis]|uniref:ABC transporter permease n=1 Tax=Paenactinomyces guangxiensis TaxID=1490290 RepID=A0A7W1WPL5_9BACL|nr:ABC transporter permease [Paenactinomyces guangxiensis]MBA4493731.1 ABC transporter permease [Paenactinomyces guangxiensis]MBH8591019.1 ABC transporter permease [Paenactinomyces guangxiensis]
MNATKDLTPDLFQPVQIEDSDKNSLSRESVGFWKDAWRRFLSNKGAILGLILIFVIGFFALVGPSMNSYTYQVQDFKSLNQESFTGDHYFGTDDLGRDVWTRTWYGAKVSLLIAFLAAFFDLVIGVTFGGISGYFGGRIDNIMQRMIEILVGIPNLIVIILMLLIFDPGIVPIAIALSITGWVPMARIVRAQMMKLKTQEYVLASRTLGASHQRIIIKHMIPNVMGPIIIAVTFAVPSAIFFEAFLSFIGLGLRPPEASLGVLVNEGKDVLQIFPYQLFWPALVLSLIMLAFNLVGDGLRDALDPKMRK